MDGVSLSYEFTRWYHAVSLVSAVCSSCGVARGWHCVKSIFKHGPCPNRYRVSWHDFTCGVEWKHIIFGTCVYTAGRKIEPEAVVQQRTTSRRRGAPPRRAAGGPRKTTGGRFFFKFKRINTQNVLKMCALHSCFILS